MFHQVKFVLQRNYSPALLYNALQCKQCRLYITEGLRMTEARVDKLVKCLTQVTWPNVVIV